MKIGLMRERVTIKAPVDQQSPFGEATVEFAEVAEVWASVMGVSVRDYFAGQQAGVIVTHRIFMRAYPGLTHQHMLVWRGKELQITSILEREMRSVYEILAREDP
jgi:SPP1 family predicted phage head-tail adaptor